MLFLWSILAFCFTEIHTILICYLILKLVRFYYQSYTLPPGPFPWPIIGNILLFRSKLHLDDIFGELNGRYGPVFTLWLANKPFVIITDIDIAREAFNKNDFSGRPSSYFGNFLSNDKYQDIIFTDYNRTWEVLRKIAHSAVKKHSSNEKLASLIFDCVDSTVESMISKEFIGNQFNPADYIYLMFHNIMSNSVFGTGYSADDEEFKNYKYLFTGFVEEVGPRLLLWEFSSIIRLLDNKLVKKHKKLFNEMIDSMKNRFISHYKDYDPSNERDICDALITAKNDALRDGKEMSQYLNDENLARSVFDILFAGTDSSMHTFRWILLIIAYYPKIQNTLRNEIENKIGNRLPRYEDSHRCHYVLAFISEVLRFRNIVKTGFPHKSMVNSKIGKYTIPEGVGVFVYQGIILMDEKYWSNPHEFRPERFLVNGKYITNRNKAFIPFGLGRRVCLGEKMALAQLFLVLVRFLQQTSHYNIKLNDNINEIEADPNVPGFYTPYDYQIKFEKIVN